MSNKQADQKIIFFAGEHSGDLHASHLLKKLRVLHPTAQFSGVGGPKMRNVGLETLLYRMEDFAVMGFIDVLKSLPKLISKFRQLSRKIFQENPQAVVLIDYPDFNLRLAKCLRKQGYQGKIVHYISPSVWAWRANRVHTMAKNLDLLLTIYPFESEYYADTALPVNFVGNPLSEYLAAYPYNNSWKKTFNIPEESSILALFPGSRLAELHANLPLQLQAVEMLLKQEIAPRIIAVSCNSPEHGDLIWKEVARYQFSKIHRIIVVPGTFTYELMRDSRVAIAKAGTVTLELALHHCPTVVIYKLSKLNYYICKYLVRLNLPHYCIVNILSQKEVFPEYFDKKLNPEIIFNYLVQLYGETSRRKTCLDDCKQLSNSLSGFTASEHAAKAILKKMETK
ncbi:MAG: lipid-A-disaccharide synthase [Parachlamydiaceae bacterium]|nr:lipid-A-disaccharide synthase [Parachlamydiaceae bacterium]